MTVPRFSNGSSDHDKEAIFSSEKAGTTPTGHRGSKITGGYFDLSPSPKGVEIITHVMILI